MGIVGDLVVRIIGDNSKFDKSVVDSEKKTAKFEKRAKELGKTLQNVGRKMTTFVTLPILAAGTAAIKAAADFEKQQVAFTVMLKSAEKAEALLKDIEDFAATTPFQLPGLIEGSKRLLAFGVAAEDIVQTMTDLGNAAGGDQQKLDRLTLAFGKLKAKGKASLEELNMFTEAGVPIMAQLAENAEVTTGEMFKLISTGKIGFKEVNEAIISLTRGEGQFAGLIEKQAETLTGLISTLKDRKPRTG